MKKKKKKTGFKYIVFLITKINSLCFNVASSWLLLNKNCYRASWVM